jgi:hypothetical protein
VEVNPANPSIVYATSFNDGRVQSLAGINVSWDQGETWEHPAINIAPGFNCDQVRFEEPLAFGISVDPKSPNRVYVGHDCGLAISDDWGHTWQFVTPANPRTPT